MTLLAVSSCVVCMDDVKLLLPSEDDLGLCQECSFGVVDL